MILRHLAILLCLLLQAFPVYAQDSDHIDQQALPEPLVNDVNALTEELAVEEADIRVDPNFLMDDGKSYDDYNMVTVRILDKITAESRSFDLRVGRTVAFGALRIRPMTCKKSPPIEEPESAAFLQVWENMRDAKDEWVFSGWMFASSPSLSAMDHPVYDVWVVDCKDEEKPDTKEKEKPDEQPE